ncbi:MAG: hypothetical protein KDA79_03795 [Planctomycetaceae bacterium]|nr:hypothetical protein [Planctomycetaceae bacterium]
MSLFYRLHTDRTRTPALLEDSFAGPTGSACWLVGGGPSLGQLPHAEIAASPIPKLCVNLAGSRLFRPDLWTSYDPSTRFHRTVYLDPRILKFVHERRALDLVPGTTYKVCDCPSTVFFPRDVRRGYADFLSPAHTAIADWSDSLIQAIDIAYRLGFRTIYLAGADMQIHPSPPQLKLARRHGVHYSSGGLLQDFFRDCEQAGLSLEELARTAPASHYHFGETRPLRTTANADQHYFRVVQALRLSRRNLALAGVRLISVTPDSRLNDHFPYQSVRQALRDIRRTIGDPACEPVRGLYSRTAPRVPAGTGVMRDYRPHRWTASGPPAGSRRAPAAPHDDQPPIPQHDDQEYLVEEEGPVRLAARQPSQPPTPHHPQPAAFDQLPADHPQLQEDG